MASALHEYQYSVQVRGRFDQLMSDGLNSEDPDLLLQKIQSRQKKDQKAAKEKPVKEESAPATKTSTPQVRQAEKQVAEDEQPKFQHKGGRNEKKGGRQQEAADEEFDAAVEPSVPAFEQPEERSHANHGRGGFTKSRSRAPGQREFDRHSGSIKTGVKPVLKKDGYGSGNWGTIEDELEVTMAPEGALTEEPPFEEKEKAEESAEKSMEPVEEEQKTLTLKEYKELKKASKPKVELKTTGGREANDGKDVFSDMVAVNQPRPVEQFIDVLAETEAPSEDSKPAFFETRSQMRGRGRGAADRVYGRSERVPVHTEPEKDSAENATGETEQLEPVNAERGRGGFDRGGRGRGRQDRGAGHTERSRGRGRGFSNRGFSVGERGSGRGFSRGGGDHFERGGSRGGFNSEDNRGGMDSGRGRGSFGQERGRGGFGHERGRGGVEHERGRGGFDHERGRGGFDHERGRGGLDHERGRGGFDHDRGRGGFDTERGRGGRGGFSERGRGGRGRPVRGGFRGRRSPLEHDDVPQPSAPMPPSMDSDVDFPSLK